MRTGLQDRGRLVASALAGGLIVIVLIGWSSALAASRVVYLSHHAATDRLRAADIDWYSTGDCHDRNNPECTSFEHIRKATIDGVITLKTASDCRILITGGTETGHGTGTYTHWNGWKVDIARRDCVGKYIKRNFKYVGHISGWGYQYRAPSGNLYTDEGTHWDILYYTCGGCTMSSPSPEPSDSESPTPSPSPGAQISPTPDSSLSPAPAPTTSISPDPIASPSTSITPATPTPATPTPAASAVPQPSTTLPPPQPGPEPEPSGPPIIDPLRIADHLG